MRARLRQLDLGLIVGEWLRGGKTGWVFLCF